MEMTHFEKHGHRVKFVTRQTGVKNMIARRVAGSELGGSDLCVQKAL